LLSIVAFAVAAIAVLITMRYAQQPLLELATKYLVIVDRCDQGVVSAQLLLQEVKT
jgi:hypothetical protein